MGEEEQETFNMEDIVANNNMLLNTLIDLLIEKDLISEEELMKKLEEQAHEHGEGDECCKEDGDKEKEGCCCSHD